MLASGHGPAHESSGAGADEQAASPTKARSQAAFIARLWHGPRAMDESEKKEPEQKPEPDPKPEADEDPVADLKKGIGLLFRAAKTAAQGAAHRAKDAGHAEKVEKVFKDGVDDLQKAFDRLQSDKIEGALKEIGRAVGNVAQTIERELRGDDDKNKKP